VAALVLRAAEVAGVQVAALEIRPRRPVEHDDALGEERAEATGPVGGAHPADDSQTRVAWKPRGLNVLDSSANAARHAFHEHGHDRDSARARATLARRSDGLPAPDPLPRAALRSHREGPHPH